MHGLHIYRALVVGLLGAIAMEIAVLPRQLENAFATVAPSPQPALAAAPPSQPGIVHVRAEAVGSIDDVVAAMVGEPVIALQAITPGRDPVWIVIDR